MFIWYLQFTGTFTRPENFGLLKQAWQAYDYNNGELFFLWFRWYILTGDFHRPCTFWTPGITLEYSPKWKRNSVNSAKLVNLVRHWRINWSEVVVCTCLCFGSILVSCTRSGRFEPFYCNDKYFCHWICWIQWQHLGETPFLCLFPQKILQCFSLRHICPERR